MSNNREMTAADFAADLDYCRSIEEQLPLDCTLFKKKDGIYCTQTVNGKKRDGGKKMNGDVAKFKGGLLKLWWNDKWYEVPSMAAFHEWTMDSICPTPEGVGVEPDHPDSWLSLAGLV